MTATNSADARIRKAMDGVMASVEATLGRQLRPDERPVVEKHLAAPLARLQMQLEELEKRAAARKAASEITPAVALVVLKADAKITALERAEGRKAAPMETTHPDVYRELLKIAARAGDPVDQGSLGGIL